MNPNETNVGQTNGDQEQEATNTTEPTTFVMTEMDTDVFELMRNPAHDVPQDIPTIRTSVTSDTTSENWGREEDIDIFNFGDIPREDKRELSSNPSSPTEATSNSAGLFSPTMPFPPPPSPRSNVSPTTPQTFTFATLVSPPSPNSTPSGSTTPLSPTFIFTPVEDSANQRFDSPSSSPLTRTPNNVDSQQMPTSMTAPLIQSTPNSQSNVSATTTSLSPNVFTQVGNTASSPSTPQFPQTPTTINVPVIPPIRNSSKQSNTSTSSSQPSTSTQKAKGTLWQNLYSLINNKSAAEKERDAQLKKEFNVIKPTTPFAGKVYAVVGKDVYVMRMIDMLNGVGLNNLYKVDMTNSPSPLPRGDDYINVSPVQNGNQFIVHKFSGKSAAIQQAQREYESEKLKGHSIKEPERNFSGVVVYTSAGAAYIREPSDNSASPNRTAGKELLKVDSSRFPGGKLPEPGETVQGTVTDNQTTQTKTIVAMSTRQQQAMATAQAEAQASQMAAAQGTNAPQQNTYTPTNATPAVQRQDQTYQSVYTEMTTAAQPNLNTPQFAAATLVNVKAGQQPPVPTSESEQAYTKMAPKVRKALLQYLMDKHPNATRFALMSFAPSTTNTHSFSDPKGIANPTENGVLTVGTPNSPGANQQQIAKVFKVSNADLHKLTPANVATTSNTGQNMGGPSGPDNNDKGTEKKNGQGRKGSKNKIGF